MYIWVCKKCFTIEMSRRAVNTNEKGSILLRTLKCFEDLSLVFYRVCL